MHDAASRPSTTDPQGERPPTCCWAPTLYWQVRGLDLPHVYLGAVRHSLTVGFMMTLILGVGQRLLPILGQTLLPWSRLVLPTFLLLGVGNFLRVATDQSNSLGPPRADSGNPGQQ